MQDGEGRGEDYSISLEEILVRVREKRESSPTGERSKESRSQLVGKGLSQKKESLHFNHEGKVAVEAKERGE